MTHISMTIRCQRTGILVAVTYPIEHMLFYNLKKFILLRRQQQRRDQQFENKRKSSVNFTAAARSQSMSRDVSAADGIRNISRSKRVKKKCL